MTVMPYSAKNPQARPHHSTTVGPFSSAKASL
jgi:hypothetical protein